MAAKNVSITWHSARQLHSAKECTPILVTYKDNTLPRVAGNNTQVLFEERIDKWCYLDDILGKQEKQ